MPTSPLQLCAEQGCGQLVKSGRCEQHRKEQRRESEKRRPSSHSRGYTRGWANFAREFLADNPHCISQIHAGKGIPATDADHIDGLGPTGPRGFDRSNLAPYCHSCHSSKTARHDGGFGRATNEEDGFMPWSPSQQCSTPTCRNLVTRGMCEDCQRKKLAEIDVTVVAGPPAAGKTTYVNQRKGPNDLVIDLDAIAVALGSDVSHDHNQRLLPFMFAARDAVIDRMSRPNDVQRFWIIRTAPTFKERSEWWQATVVVLETPPDECKARARRAGRPPHWDRLIDAWWDEYQPRHGETVVRPQ